MGDSCTVCERTPNPRQMEYGGDCLFPATDPSTAATVDLCRNCLRQLEKLGGLHYPEEHPDACVIDWKAWAIYLRRLQYATACGERGKAAPRD